MGARGAARDARRDRRRRVGRRDRLGLRAHGHAGACCSRRSTACCRPRTPTSPRSPAARSPSRTSRSTRARSCRTSSTGDSSVALLLRRPAGRGRLARDRRRPRARHRGARPRRGRRRARRPRPDRRSTAASARRCADVYAIGDIVPGPALAHKSSDEGIIAVEDAAGMETHALEYVDIPRATFCAPERRLVRPDRGAGARAGTRHRRRQAPVRRGRRRHGLRRPLAA